MYNLLKQKQELKYNTPSGNFKIIPEILTGCEKTVSLKGNYINCLQKCNTTCGNGQKKWKVICPWYAKCSGPVPANTLKDESCIGQECSWKTVTAPTYGYFTDLNNLKKLGDCGTGKQVITPMCMINNRVVEDKYCMKSYCPYGICQIPETKINDFTNYLGCKCSAGRCRDTYNNTVDTSICDKKFKTSKCFRVA